MVGNPQAQQVIEHYFTHIRDREEVVFPFVLLEGPAGVGKKACVESHIQQLLGLHIATDYMAIYDLSRELDKQHTLKVEVSAKDQLIEIEGKRYQDIGARDAAGWLSLAPVGKWKVLFLENIERMSIGAANALLKNLEEPLPGRIIIATTTNKQAILDTILSRAFVVHFQEMRLSEIEGYLAEHYQHLDAHMRKFAASYSIGRLGEAERLLQDSEQLGEMATQFTTLMRGIEEGGSIVTLYTILRRFNDHGSLTTLLDAVIYSLTDRNQITLAQKWLKAKSYLQRPVNEEHILFDLVL